MFVTIINDCRDANEQGRQSTRASILFPSANVTFMGVHNFNEIEAAGNLVDVLDATAGAEGIVLVNAAPRHGSGKKYPNGTPFGFFKYGKTVVASTVAGHTLSLVKKMGIMDKFEVTDLPTVIDHFVAKGKFPAEERDRVVNTQFRSYEYLPFLAKWVYDGEDVPAENVNLDEIPAPTQCVWWVDNFGNSKTTILPEEIQFEAGKTVQTTVGELTCYNRLKDVPDAQAGLIVGSSGYKQKRFLEVVVQGKSAAQFFRLKSGQELFEA